MSLKRDQIKEYNTVRIYQDENEYDTAEGSILEAEFGGNGPRRHAFALRQRITTTIR